MRSYSWKPGDEAVTVIDKKTARPLQPKLQSDGFAWGEVLQLHRSDPEARTEAIKGSIRLAFAILFDALGDKQLAWRHHMGFKKLVIETLPVDRPWSIGLDEVHAAVRGIARRWEETEQSRRIMSLEPPPASENLFLPDGGVSPEDNAPDRLTKRITR